MRHNNITFPILPSSRGGREYKVESDCIKPASQNGSRRLLARLSIISMAFLLIHATGAMGMVTTSCVSCHGALDRRNAEPVRLWERDLHREAGLGCHDCHGGDPFSLESAMDLSKGFVGVPTKMDSVRLCGGCHSDPGHMPDPTVATDQMDQYLSGPHGIFREKNNPTCATCHGSHGIYRVTDPSSPVFPTRVVSLCLQCHAEETSGDKTGPWRYVEDVHGRALAHETNTRAPACHNCHGAHRAAVPTIAGTQMICGNCHTMEYEYFQAGPHARSLRVTGEPSCTHCHGYHGIEATGIEEIVGQITENCQECHLAGSGAIQVGLEIDENLGQAMKFLGSLQEMSENFRLAGVETGEMDSLNREAHGWLLQVESAIHSVDTNWEELTGMAKVKMMASWDVARDYNLEKGIRRVVLLFTAFLALSILALLAFKLKLIEKDQKRRQLLGSPEARQREQEHHRK